MPQEIELPTDASVDELRRRAQDALGVSGRCSLISPAGTILEELFNMRTVCRNFESFLSVLVVHVMSYMRGERGVGRQAADGKYLNCLASVLNKWACTFVSNWQLYYIVVLQRQ